MQSQYVITTGASNTSVGFHSMYDNRSGSSNVGLGARTMFNQRISNYNVAIGYDSMDGVTASQTAVSDYNTAVGYQSLQSIQGGDNNTVIGKDSGNAITTGSNNVIIGSNTGSTIATSSNNIIISDCSGNIRQSFDINGAATFSGALSGTSASFSDNVVLTGSSKQIRLEDSSFVNFTNTGNTIQRGYIQHDGANLNIASPVGSITLINALQANYGISFPTRSADVTVLDNYEEGSWTPTLPLGGTVATLYSASYVIIGKLLSYQFYISCSGIPSNSDRFEVSMPKTPSFANFYWGGNIAFSSSFNTSTWRPIVGPTRLYFESESTGSPIQNSAATGLTAFIVSGSYYV